MMPIISVQHELLLEAAREQILAELEELFELPAGTPPESFMERLVIDEELRKTVRKRFEQGRSSGKFPLLSRCESHFPKEAREMYLVVGWRLLVSPAAPEKPWDRGPYNGNEEHYREALYNGEASAATDLQSFADEWLEELGRVGYLGVGGSPRLPLKQSSGGSAVAKPASIPPFDEEAYPVRFEGTREVLWLQLDGERSKHGHREIRVANEPMRTDKAILAALTAVEARTIDLKRLHKALDELKFLPPGRSIYDQWCQAFDNLPPEQKSERKRPELVKNLQHHQSLDYVLLLLRHHRPGFDDLPEAEKLALLERTYYHVNNFLETLRRLAAFLEFGVPGKYTKDVMRDPDGDVKAAVLRDVVGLDFLSIGEELGLDPPKDIKIKGDHPTARSKVKRGRDFLEGFLGHRGWQQRVRDMKAEAELWGSLSVAEQHAEDLAEHLGIPYEEALQIAKKEEAYFEGRRRSRGELEND